MEWGDVRTDDHLVASLEHLWTGQPIYPTISASTDSPARPSCSRRQHLHQALSRRLGGGEKVKHWSLVDKYTKDVRNAWTLGIQTRRRRRSADTTLVCGWNDDEIASLPGAGGYALYGTRIAMPRRRLHRRFDVSKLERDTGRHGRAREAVRPWSQVHTSTRWRSVRLGPSHRVLLSSSADPM
jgi:hypothetical protein